jgi:hypothetical protein
MDNRLRCGKLEAIADEFLGSVHLGLSDRLRGHMAGESLHDLATMAQAAAACLAEARAQRAEETERAEEARITEQLRDAPKPRRTDVHLRVSGPEEVRP